MATRKQNPKVEYRLWVFENRILRRNLGPRAVRMGSRVCSTTHSLCRSNNRARSIKSRRLRWAGYVARMEDGWSAVKIFTGELRGKIPIGRPRR